MILLHFNTYKLFTYTALFKTLPFFIHKRFTGNKPIGHVKKILDLINKPCGFNTPPSSPILPHTFKLALQALETMPLFVENTNQINANLYSALLKSNYNATSKLNVAQIHPFILNPPSILSDTKYLPPVFQKKNLISGLMTFNVKQREILNSNTLLGTELRKFIIKKMIHIVYSFTHKKHNLLSQNIYYATKNIFSSVSEENMFKDLYDLLGKNLLPLTQSLCIYFWGNASFTFNTFKELCDDLDIKCDSFKNQEIKISHFIELFFAKKLKGIMQNYTSFDGEYHLINPDGFGDMNVYFNELESIERTSQRHCDLLIIEKDKNKDLENLMKFYIDIKTFATFSAEHCRFSLFHANKQLLLRYISDMPIAMKNYIDKNKLANNLKDPIHTLYKQLQEIKQESIIKNNLDEINKKFNKMLKTILQAFTNKDFQKLNLSFAVDAGKDSHYLEFYHNVVVPNLHKFEQFKDINKIIPKGNKINNDEHRTTIKKVIEDILPNEMKKDALEYFENIIVPKIKL